MDDKIETEVCRLRNKLIQDEIDSLSYFLSHHGFYRFKNIDAIVSISDLKEKER